MRALNADRVAVVLVSGGDTQTPYTTPTEACRIGRAAGDTHTAIRRGLLDEGHRVFTAPAMNGPGEVRPAPPYGGFGDGPAALGVELTVDTVGPIERGGAHLANFVAYLHEQHRVDGVHLVGHSMGGMFSRAAIRRLLGEGLVRPLSLTTLGTPWQGSFVGDVVLGWQPESLLAGEAVAEQAVAMLKEIAEQRGDGLLHEITMRFITGAGEHASVGGWNADQRGVLDEIPVTVLGGDHCRHPGGDQSAWPNDGLVGTQSQLAAHVEGDIAPRITRQRLPLVHSLAFCQLLGLPDETAITYNEDSINHIKASIAGAQAV